MGGSKLNRTNSTSPPPNYTAHTRSPFWLWQKNNNNTIVFVGFTNGRSWRTSFSPQSWAAVQVLMPLRGCVSFTISPPPQQTYTYSLRTSVLLTLSVAYLSACLPSPIPVSLIVWGLSRFFLYFFYSSWIVFYIFIFLCVNVFLLWIFAVESCRCDHRRSSCSPTRGWALQVWREF